VAARRLRLLTVTAALAALLALSGCTGGSGTANANFVGADGGGITLVPPQDRREPVALSGTGLDGSTIDLAAYRGKVVVLNVWASWCAPCRKEAPDLQAASLAMGSGTAFLGLNIRDTTAAAQAYQKSFGITYPSVVDQGTQLLALRGAVSPTAIPSTVVLDDQGRIAARLAGATTRVTLAAVVEAVRSGATTLTVPTPSVGASS